MSEPITITEAAASKVWDLMQEEGNLKLKLRVYVTGGGCSGMQYGFTFDENSQSDDTMINKTLASSFEEPLPMVQVVVDSISLQYLHGSEIDYKSTVESEEFIIRNPNAKTTCGCGSSFATE